MDPAPAAASEGGTVPAGLTTTEARRRLAETGPNRVPTTRATPAWRALLGQFVHFFAGMLWAAGILAIIAGLPQLGIAIFAVVVINGLFAFAQEYRAEAAAARLRDLVPRRATVVRDGAPLEIDAAELVPGDLVMLNGGDRVSADELVVASHGIQVDESILTGESATVRVEPGSRLRAGTFLVQGEGLAVVRAPAPPPRSASWPRSPAPSNGTARPWPSSWIGWSARWPSRRCRWGCCSSAWCWPFTPRWPRGSSSPSG